MKKFQFSALGMNFGNNKEKTNMKFDMKRFLSTLVVAIAGGFIALFANNYIGASGKGHEHLLRKNQTDVNVPGQSFSGLPDLTAAAEKSVHAVVHVQTQFMQNASSGNPLFDFFYGYQQQQVPVQSSGSGVIISENGYIVTNNHVIDNSDEIQVVLNDKRSFAAKLVGKDETTDLALLKIDAKDLPYLMYGNSDDLKIGEWVLAVGNPFNLTSTVTAGIVSAKARNINILSKNYAIESFIQTDAAVNPGNSGGALVNSSGDLVGINTAIASKTGSYVGYSFAIPVSIVKKIISDLLEFGEVQRAYLGAHIQDIDAKMAERYKLSKIEGVYVGGLTQLGAADNAGMLVGDIITKIEDFTVNSVAEVLGQISKYRPGDKVKLTIKRNGEEKIIELVLRNYKGDTSIIKTELTTILGAKFTEITPEERAKFRLNGGIKIVDLENGKLKMQGVKEGFIVTYVNRKPIKSVDDLKEIIKTANRGISFEGIYPNGMTAYYIFPVD